MKRVLLFGSVSLACVLYLVRLARHSDVGKPLGTKPLAAAPDATTQDLFLEVVGHLDKSRRLSAAGAEGAEPELVGGSAESPQRDDEVFDDEHWQLMVRSDVDLAVLMFSGAYGADVFVRHSLLNPGDKRLKKSEYGDLERLVDRLLAASSKFRTRLRDMAVQDRIAIVRDNPDAVPELHEAAESADRAARGVVDLFKSRGQSITIDEAKAKIASGEAFSARLPPNCTFIGGKIYRNESFGSLPRSDSCFEQLRYVAMEEMAVIVSWFASSGYCTYSPGIAELFRRMEAMSPREVERLAR